MNVVIEGVVAEGNKIGRKIGFPTANISANVPAQVATGVYAALVDTPFGRFGGMANIGLRPTVTNDTVRVAEVNIFDFNENLYGQHIKLTLVKFVRPEVRFASTDELIEHINQDKIDIKKILNDEF